MAMAARPPSVAQRLLPVCSWLPAYRRDWLLPDALAGLAICAVMVPESMAYAGIVGVPPIMGLTTGASVAPGRKERPGPWIAPLDTSGTA